MFWGLVWGVGFALFGALMVGIDYVGAHGVPRERAQVVRVHLTGERTACGAKAFWDNTDEEAAVFDVRDPRPGLPSTFEVRGCRGAFPVGFSGLVARTGPSADEAMVDPPDGFDVLRLAAALGGIAGVGAAAFYLLVDGVPALWRRRTAS